jgi:hypothetical protein
MKALGAAIIVLVALYIADQTFAQGKYTAAAQRMALQFKVAPVGGLFHCTFKISLYLASIFSSLSSPAASMTAVAA